MNSLDWICFGDSIGLGTAQAVGLPCNAKVGRQPHEVLAAIRDTHPSLIANRHVIISTGLSNNPAGLSHAYECIAALQSAGARDVIVLGVGPGNDKVSLDGINAKLAAQCSKVGVIFAGALPPTRDVNTDQPGIHPWDYSDVVTQINALTRADL